MLKELLGTGLAVVGAVGIMAFSASETKAATKDVDLMFVIDRSGSMGDEFNDLADNIETFFTDLSNDSRTGSIAGGLVSYLATPLLEQAITTTVATLKTAINDVSVGGGTENGIGAVDSVLPGGTLSGSAGWRNNTVKSVILITDEDADDEGAGSTGYSDLATRVSDAGYLNNIISDIEDWEDAAVPNGAIFSLTSFNNDPAGFLTDFANTKLGEIDTTPTTPGAVIPLPAGLPLILIGIGALGSLGAIRRRQEKAAA